MVQISSTSLQMLCQIQFFFFSFFQFKYRIVRLRIKDVNSKWVENCRLWFVMVRLKACKKLSSSIIQFVHCRCKQSARLNEPYYNVTEEYELRIGKNPCWKKLVINKIRMFKRSIVCSLKLHFFRSWLRIMISYLSLM